MNYKYLSFNDEKALNIINEGHVLAFPTETVFGLGVIYDKKEAFDELVSLKQRNPDKPFTIMISNIQEIAFFTDIDEKIRRVIDKYFPGEITLILKSKKTYPWIDLNQGTVGIRMSALNELNEFIARIGKPLLVTSANISGQSPLYNAEEVNDTFKENLKGIVKLDNINSSNLPSTIVKIIDGKIELIRQGKISFDEIKKTWEGEENEN